MKKVLVGLLVVILVVGVTAEIGFRTLIGKELRQSIATSAGISEQDEQPTVSFGATPLLFAAATRNVPEVQIHVPSTLDLAAQTGAPPTDINVRSLDITDSQVPIAGTLTLNTEMPTDFIFAMAEQASSQSILGDLTKVSAIRMDAARNVIIAELAQGSATVEITPKAENGELVLEASNASVLGLALPPEVSDGITHSLRQGASKFAGNLQVQHVQVTETGVKLELGGNNVNLADLQQQNATVQ